MHLLDVGFNNFVSYKNGEYYIETKFYGITDDGECLDMYVWRNFGDNNHKINYGEPIGDLDDNLLKEAIALSDMKKSLGFFSNEDFAFLKELSSSEKVLKRGIYAR